METEIIKGTFREVSEKLAQKICPGNELFAKMMSNMADTQEKIAEEIFKSRNDNQIKV